MAVWWQRRRRRRNTSPARLWRLLLSGPTPSCFSAPRSPQAQRSGPLLAPSLRALASPLARGLLRSRPSLLWLSKRARLGEPLAHTRAACYTYDMIKSFKGKEAPNVWARLRSKLPLEVQRAGLRKLMLINRAATLQDLSVPPGNRLEQLKGDRAGQWSIRINDQWRICFRWDDGDAFDVEIVDYH